MMTHRLLRAIRILSVLAAAPPFLTPEADAQAPVEIRWTPERPPPGTLIRVVAHASGSTDLDGSLVGQPLHFRRSGDTLTAFAAVPADPADTLRLSVVVRDSMRTDSLDLPIVVHIEPAPATARSGERLRVPTRFGRQPDSATAARMARESALAMEVARRSHETPRLWTDAFARPRDSRITSRFGTGRVFNGAVRSRHLGVDLAGALGAPVRAANRGVVALVADFYLAGTAIYIDHGEGFVTGYFHLSKAEVAEGDTVARGQVIGRVGATGRVTGPHLHWIARYGTVTVDPLSVVKATEPK